MLTVSPSLFSPIEWPLEEAHHHNQYISNDPYINFINDQEPNLSQSSFEHFPHNQPQTEELHTPSTISVQPPSKNKSNHNASERDRRKKLNSLYSSLSSILPGTHSMKKVSNPATVARALKYIPELQNQVEKLIQRKEVLSLSNRTSASMMKGKNGTVTLNSPAISVNGGVDEGEILIQICMLKGKRRNPSLSEVLQNLEREGFQVLHASAFSTSSENIKVFYNLHLQVKERERKIECELLKEKLLSFYENNFMEEELFIPLFLFWILVVIVNINHYIIS